MKKIILCMVAIFMMVSCATVPAGYKGVKVYLFGRKNGSEIRILNVGRYVMGPNQKLYLFPVFQQDFTWGHDNFEKQITANDPFAFQSKEGINVSVRLGISF